MPADSGDKTQHDIARKTKEEPKVANQARGAEVLARAKAFHEKLSEHYAGKIGHAKLEEVRVLLRYLSEQESFLARCVEEFERGATDKVTEAWFKYAPLTRVDDWIAAMEFHPDMSVEEMAELAFHMHELLIQVYENLVASAGSKEAHEAFDKLLRLENEQKIKNLRSTVMH